MGKQKNARKIEEDGIYMRTRSRIKGREYRGSATVEDLPIEIIWKISEYLDTDCMMSIRNLSPVFSRAVTVRFYHTFHSIPLKVKSFRKRLLHNIYSSPLCEEGLRLDLTKSVLYLEWMETEYVMLESILRRYKLSAEDELFPLLWAVEKEFLNRINSLFDRIPFRDLLADLRILNPSASLPIWSKFIDDFDKKLEPNLKQRVPFETRAVDILSCCPSSNQTLSIQKTVDEDSQFIQGSFRIIDACSERYQPRVERNKSIGDLEGTLLWYIRNLVRSRNCVHVNSLYDEIMGLEMRVTSTFLTEEDRDQVVTRLGQCYTQLDSPIYEKLVADIKEGSAYFDRLTTCNLTNNFVEVFVEYVVTSSSHLPLLMGSVDLFNVRPSDMVDKSFLSLTSHSSFEYCLSRSASGEDIVQESPSFSPFLLRTFTRNSFEGPIETIVKKEYTSDESEFTFAMNVSSGDQDIEE